MLQPEPPSPDGHASPAPKAKKPKPPKKYIKSTVTVHDRTQIEAVFDYFLHRPDGGGAKPAKSLRYRVEAFLFFPRQFGLNAVTYPKERFYSDVRPLIRFREPRLGFKRMRGLKGEKDSPLLYLKRYVGGLHQGIAPEPEQNALAEVRLFACSLIGNFLKNIDRWRKRFDKLRRAAEPAAPEVLADHFARMSELLRKMHDTLLAYREISDDAARLPEGVGTALREELKLIDEYCYYRLRDGIAFLLLVAEGYRRRDDIPEVVAFDEGVMQLLALHDDHAARNGFLEIGPDSSEPERERYMRRRGELKRRVWGVLFLELRTIPLFAFQQHMGPMLAAGIAAFWAVVTQIMILRSSVIAANQASMDVLGISGMVFLLLAVLAYVIKDRIKEIGRSYFRSGLFRKLPDHSERIYYEHRKGEPKAVGKLREVTKFERIGAIPSSVALIRRAHGTLEEDDAIDAVLHYTKEVDLQGNIKIQDRYPLRAVHDILRLNIDSCLPRLGEPTRAMNVVDEHGRVHAMGFPKVYYLDMALRYSQRLGETGDDSPAEEEAIDFYRLVIDKTGLLRVERLT